MGEKVLEDIDVLVVGGGIAGIFAAIKAKEAGAEKVVQVDKGHVGKSGNSCFAAGVMHVYFPEEDDLDDRVWRLVRAQNYLAQQDLMRDHMEQSYETTLEMEQWGVEFLKTTEGKIERRPGRGQYPVIAFKGPEMMEALRKACLRKGVKQVQRVMVTELLQNNDRILGAVGFNTQTGDFHVFKAKTTILATGSTWYKGLLPGQRDCTGDGYGMGFRAGAVLSGGDSNDMPSNLMPSNYDIGPGMNKFVGEGGRFINSKGEAFMEKYNPKLKDRAGLRFLSMAFSIEAQKGNAPIYLDMTHLTKEQVRHLRVVLPLPMRQFDSVGLVVDDQFKKPVEWMVCAPVGRPGFIVNRSFETSLKGLYACGEAASAQAVVTGLSSAATSGAVAGKAAALASKQLAYQEANDIHVAELKQRTLQPLSRKVGLEPDQVLLSLQEAILPSDVLLLREESRMKKALSTVESIREHQVPFLCAYDSHYLRMALEAENMALVAEIHLRSSIMRKESRVALREDYPDTDNDNWLKWINAQGKNGKIDLYCQDVPIDEYPYKPEKGKHRYHMASWLEN